ncbi:MAG: branched-chain amino acid transaminase [Chloroflexi bacterium]|nr:branched-chain amino acid transaminase [Chloroflexota bacterium]
MAAQKKCDWIWQNGEWVAWADAKVHVTTHALHYGSSVFEGIRAYSTPDGPAILALEPHVRRMFNSCKIARMDVPYTPEQVSSTIIEAVQRNNHESCYIRPLVYRGANTVGLDPRPCPVELVIFTMEWGRYLGAEAIEQGVQVMVSSWRRMAPDTLPAMAKIGGQYINSQLITMEAKDNGFDEGIGLDVNGYVSEGAGENIFLAFDGVLFTPPLGASILGGVTRACAITLAHDLGYEVREQLIAREMLYTADEMFFTGTAAEITPVRSVDRIPVGSGQRGPITQRIQQEFFDITAGRLPDRFGWLTPVRSTTVSEGLVRCFESR